MKKLAIWLVLIFGIPSVAMAQVGEAPEIPKYVIGEIDFRVREVDSPLKGIKYDSLASWVIRRDAPFPARSVEISHFIGYALYKETGFLKKKKAYQHLLELGRKFELASPGDRGNSEMGNTFPSDEIAAYEKAGWQGIYMLSVIKFELRCQMVRFQRRCTLSKSKRISRFEDSTG